MRAARTRSALQRTWGIEDIAERFHHFVDDLFLVLVRTLDGNVDTTINNRTLSTAEIAW